MIKSSTVETQCSGRAARRSKRYKSSISERFDRQLWKNIHSKKNFDDVATLLKLNSTTNVFTGMLPAVPMRSFRLTQSGTILDSILLQSSNFNPKVLLHSQHFQNDACIR